MLIFNTTFHTDDEVHEEFLHFMSTIYIPQAIKSGILTDPRFCRIRPNHQQHGSSYSLQFRVADDEALNKWHDDRGEVLHQRLIHKFGSKVTGFVTVMDEMDTQQNNG